MTTFRRKAHQKCAIPKKNFCPIPQGRFPIDGETSASAILDKMRYVGFQGRQMGRAFDVWKQMLADPECTILMGMSGAMVPAGCATSSSS